MSSTVSFFATVRSEKVDIVINCGASCRLKGNIQSIEISFVVHSTEDEDRIKNSVRRLVGWEAEMNQEKLDGHHGNKILKISIHATGNVAAAVFERIVAGFSRESKREIASSMRMMMDEHSALYLRLNKQSLVCGRIELGGNETVRVKVKPRLFQLKQGAEGFYRSVFA